MFTQITSKFQGMAGTARTLALAIGTTACLAVSASAATLFADRTAFELTLASSVTDDFSSAYAPGIYTDAAMSAFLGETDYTTTGYSDLNIIGNPLGNQHYCAGCNGSFKLGFTSTTVGTAQGVFGVGLDVYSAQNVYGTTAFVTFGDGATMNYTLPDARRTSDYFWGITDTRLISSIHFGLADGGTNTDGTVQRFAMDNLTIGSAKDTGTDPLTPVPLPAAGWLMIGAFGLLGAARARRRG